MCGIAGFSLSEADLAEVNPKTLTKRLALSIESRGRDATGYAYRGVDSYEGEVMLLKRPVPASQFINAKMHHSIQRGTNTVLIHTRAATTGSVKDNDNNHPIVVKPLGEHPGIVGIHNGVLWNHKELWKQYPELDAQRMGEVDSQVIFQMLSRKGRPSLNEIDGDASIAWMPTAEPGELNIARMGGRPLAAATTPGGSILFASTMGALVETIALFPQFDGVTTSDMAELDPGEWLTVVDGEIIASGSDFPVISLSRSYTYKGGKSTAVKTGADYWNRHPMEDDGWDLPSTPTVKGGTSVLPFKGEPMSAADKATYQASMADAGDAATAEVVMRPPALEPRELTEFDIGFFHYVTGNVFVATRSGNDPSPELISAFLDLIYTEGDEGIVDVWLDDFCAPAIELVEEFLDNEKE